MNKSAASSDKQTAEISRFCACGVATASQKTVSAATTGTDLKAAFCATQTLKSRVLNTMVQHLLKNFISTKLSRWSEIQLEEEKRRRKKIKNNWKKCLCLKFHSWWSSKVLKVSWWKLQKPCCSVTWLCVCLPVPLGAEHGALHRVWNGPTGLQRGRGRGTRRWLLGRIPQEESYNFRELRTRGRCGPQWPGACRTLLLLHKRQTVRLW